MITPTNTEWHPYYKTLPQTQNNWRNLSNLPVKKGKACGPDGITSNDLLLHEDVPINGLHKVIKRSLLSGKFPTEWKKARVTAVYKKGSKKCCSNYRPISLLPIPSKVVEHLICSQLNDHLTTFNLQNEHMWGFRKQVIHLRRSTVHDRKMEVSNWCWKISWSHLYWLQKSIWQCFSSRPLQKA